MRRPAAFPFTALILILGLGPASPASAQGDAWRIIEYGMQSLQREYNAFKLDQCSLWGYDKTKAAYREFKNRREQWGPRLEAGEKAKAEQWDRDADFFNKIADTCVLYKYQSLSKFLDDKSPSARVEFLDAAPPELRDWRTKIHEALDLLVAKGGKFDGNYKLKEAGKILESISQLPPGELYFVGLLEHERAQIVRENGPGSFTGNGWGGMKCTDRAYLLQERMNQRLSLFKKRNWTVGKIDANQDGSGHSSLCATYGSGALIELMADPWGDMHIPAYQWWGTWDKPAFEKIKAAGAQPAGHWCNYALWGPTQPHRR